MLRNPRRAMAPAVATILCGGLAFAGFAATSADAAGTPGVTSKTITIGGTAPLTGLASPGYKEVDVAANAVFKYVNSKGGINGRKITYILKDDCYNLCGGNPNTGSQTQALLAKPVFATAGSIGTPTQEGVEKLLKKHGVPQLFVLSGSKAWNSATTYPELFGWLPSYIQESKILGTYMKAHFAGKKICFLGQNDDFGTGGITGLHDVHVNPSLVAYYSAFALGTQGGGYMTQFVKDEKNQSCQVVFLDTIPGATAATLGNAEALGFSPQWVISSVGSDPVTVKNELGATPDNEPGAISFAPLPASTDTNPWNAWMYKVLEADPADFPGFNNSTPIDGNMATGIGWAVTFCEALRAEGKTVTRPGFVATLLKTTFQTPALTSLKYSKTNHEGISGGYIDTILNDHQTTPIAGKKVYVTTMAATSPVSGATRLSTAVPAWLK